jgi:hypothetical protein
MRSRLTQPIGGAPTWSVALLGAAALVLVPWSVALTRHLPSHHVARHWDVAWAGFDAGVALVLAVTVVSAFRDSAWFPGLAMAAAAMLVCDAWFDVVTAAGTSSFWKAVVTALVGELPLALVCVLASRSALRVRVPRS